MAEIIKDTNIILKWIEAKQSNEQKMLFRLNNLFKGSIPRNKIRNVVLRAFDLMHYEVSNGSVWPAYNALVAEEGLAVWDRLTRPTGIPHHRLIRMHSQLALGDHANPRLDCNDFSELIRVIGAWIENGGGFGAKNINKAYRVGVGKVESSKNVSDKYLRYLGILRKKYGWQFADKINAEERRMLYKLSVGDLIARQSDRDELIWGKGVRQREDPNQHHEIEKHVSDWWVKPRFNKQSGMQLFRANRNDLCKKIDLLFGFITGATISGTTTDTAMVLEAFGGQMKPPLHAGYYLFPVATIAASLHHSLLEAGLALTLVGAIDSYCAGFYTTLTPKGGLPGELEDASAILKEYEGAPDNRHLLIWYNGNEKLPVGCIHWTKPYEIRDAKRLAEGRGLMQHIQGMPQIPDRWAAMRLLKVMAPRLFAYLPEEFQLR